MRSGDGGKVDALLADVAPAEADAALRAVAESALAGRQWSLAAGALARVREPDIAMQLQSNLAKNLAALQDCRPALSSVTVTCTSTQFKSLWFVRSMRAISWSFRRRPFRAMRRRWPPFITIWRALASM